MICGRLWSVAGGLWSFMVCSFAGGLWSFAVVYGGLLVACGRLLVVCSRFLVVCGCLWLLSVLVTT